LFGYGVVENTEGDAMSGRDVAPERTGRRDGVGKDVIAAAALRTFSERGYFGTSIRDIAAAADMTAASLYHHYSSKQDILRVVMTAIMQDALQTTRDGLVRAGSTPAEQLTGLVRSWVEFHAARQIEARVGAAELHCLQAEGRELVVALRDEQEHMFLSVIRRGVENGAFRTPHPREAARAIINMGTAVATWYRKDGGITSAKLAETYVTLALATVEARDIP
jgi:AcrR family transcriptional regulator